VILHLFATASKPALGITQTLIQWVSGGRGLSLGVKWPGRETDHSPPSTAEIKNGRSYTSTPLQAFMMLCLIKKRLLLHDVIIKHRDKFTFTFECHSVLFLHFTVLILSLIMVSRAICRVKW